MHSPFATCSEEVRRIFRQPYRDRESWLTVCLALGAERTALDAFDADAVRYAATTSYPNSEVIAYCRTIAVEALERQEPLPTSVEQAIETAIGVNLDE